MKRTRLILGLDIGDDPVRAALGEVIHDQLQVHAAVEHPAEGFRKGFIDEMPAARATLEQLIQRVLKDAEIHTPPRTVISLSSEVRGYETDGSVQIPSGKISMYDQQRAIQQAKTSANIPQEDEILNFYPSYYELDNEQKVHNPVEMRARRLRVQGFLLTAPRTVLTNLQDLLRQVGIRDFEFHTRAYGSSLLVTDSMDRLHGVVVIETGKQSSDVAVWYQNSLLDVFNLPVGYVHYVRDVAQFFQIPLGIAEDLVMTNGALYFDRRTEDQLFVELNWDSKTYKVSREELARVLTYRAEDFFHRIRTRLEEKERLGLLASGAILNGMMLLLGGILEAGMEILEMNVREPRVTGVTGSSQQADDPGFFPLYGLMRKYAVTAQDAHGLRSGLPIQASSWKDKLREFWKWLGLE